MNVKLLKKLLLECASSETAYDSKSYKGGLDGHCFATAYVVKEILGGEIVCGRIHGERHAWNLLDNGELIDLSSEQFVNGDGFTSLSNKYKIHKPRTINPRFIKFYNKIMELNNDISRSN